MSNSLELELKPNVLQWARERSNYTYEILAKKINIDSDAIKSWEKSGIINFSLLKKLSHITHTPIGYLYLEKPPKDSLPIKDFRTIGNANISNPSVDLKEVINIALICQDWFREYVKDQADDPINFIESCKLSESSKLIAQKMRKDLEFNFENRKNLLPDLIKAIENKRILVLRSGIVGNNTRRRLDISEFRGFALSDKLAPLIFINTTDSVSGQLFTLSHELAHLWIGLTGVSNTTSDIISNINEERKCNEIAVEFLVPEDEYRNLRKKNNQLEYLASYFHVSKLVIIRREYDLGIIKFETFREKYEDEEKKISKIKKNKSGGGNFFKNEIARFGHLFSKTLIESTLQGKTPYRDALQMLCIKNTNTIHNLAKELNIKE